MLIRDTFAPIKKIIGVTTLLGAADVDLIVTSTNMKVGAYTVAAQPGTPSRVSVTATAGDTADTFGTVVIVGTDNQDKALSETVVPVAGSTVYTTGYFKTITSVTGVGWVIDESEGTNDTITVGVSMESEQTINGESITFMCMSGNIWINPHATAVADATSIKFVAGMTMDLVVKSDLSMISDSSGATYQIVTYSL